MTGGFRLLAACVIWGLMANFTYTSDIIADALFRAGEPTDGTSDFAAEALTYLNSVYMQICRGGSELVPECREDWAWLRKSSPGVLILQPPITTGTVTATLGSSSITFSTVPTNYTGSNLSVAKWFLRVDGNPDIFKIATHTSGTTSAILDSVYTGVSGSGQGYTLFLTDYDLATDLLRPVAPMRSYRNSGWNSRDDYKIYAADLDAMEEQWPLALIEIGIPDYFAMIGETTTGTKRVRFNRCGGPTSTTAYRIEYEYLFRPTALTSPGTSEEPVLPLEWRHLLADFTLAYLFGIKNDERVAAVSGAAKAGLMGMAGENRYKTVTATRNMFRVKAREAFNRRLGPVRTESGAILG